MNSLSFEKDGTFSTPGYNEIMAPAVFKIDLQQLSPVLHDAHFSARDQGLNIKERIISDFEFVFIVGGGGQIQILDKVFFYKANDLILIPPFIRHQYQGSKIPTPHYALHFDLAPDFAYQYASHQQKIIAFKEMQMSTNLGQDLPFLLNDFPKNIIVLIEELIHTQRDFDLKKQPPWQTQLVTKELLLKIIRLYFEQALEINLPNQQLSKSLAYIENNFTGPLSIDALCEIEGISTNYYSTVFKRRFGLSPVEYITELRVAKAKDLLKQKQLRIKEIAHLVGYEDEYYFSKLFKRHTSRSPKQYRDYF